MRVDGKPDVVIREGDIISLNATTGEVFFGHIAAVDANFDSDEDLKTILSWADEVCAREYVRGADGRKRRGLEVRANADYGRDAARARNFGAKGVGLCRTEHMFFETERLPIVQEMILSKNEQQRQEALDKLLPFQRSDFEDMFEAMDGCPVIIRLLDPPLHEFLPDYTKLLQEVSELKVKSNTDASLQPKYKQRLQMLASVESLHESNPMMGLRGVRVGVMFPSIHEMQVRAIMEAACTVAKRGKHVQPEIMIPLISHVNELKQVKAVCQRAIETVLKEQNMTQLNPKIGTMVETPRAALTAGAIATEAAFFSFGTNDLTQMTFGISRDDAEREFLLEYVTKKIFPSNPFQTLDKDGVGRLIQLATSEGRAVQPGLSVGVCGEHGGDATTIGYCHEFGLDYVSCSPFRVPSARLAAAHAALK